MKKLAFSVLFLSLIGAMMTVPASASSVLYDNSSVNKDLGYWEIDTTDNWTSNYFIDTNTGSATSATFAVWIFPGDVMTSVDWVLSSGSDGTGTVYNFGTALTTETYDYGTDAQKLGADLVLESISLPGVSLTKNQQYFFTLTNADGDGIQDDGAFWAQNTTSPSGSMYGYSNYSGTPNTEIGAETFALYSGGTATPEPSSLLLLGSGLVGLAGLLKRKLSA